MKYFTAFICSAVILNVEVSADKDCDNLKVENGDLLSLLRSQSAIIKRLRKRIEQLEITETTTTSYTELLTTESTNGTTILRLIKRDEWLAQPAKSELTNLVHPISKVIIAHSATQDCSSQV